MKTYTYIRNGEIIELVRKDEHDAVVRELNERLTKQQADMLDTIVKLRQEKRTQVAVAFGDYISVSEVASKLISDVKTALAGGIAHSRSRLELAVSRHSAELAKLTFDAPPNIKTDVRLFDLVRYMRSELHQANLITDDEYAWLCSANPGEDTADGSPSRERLETYDDLRAELTSWQSMASQYSAEREHNANMAGMWQSLAERLATALDNLSHDCMNHSKDIQKIRWGYDGDGGAKISAEQIEECCAAVNSTLTDYESAKKAKLHTFTPCESCEGPLVCSDLGNCYAAKSGNLPNPLAEAVKRMEAVPFAKLDEAFLSSVSYASSLEYVRVRLISAVKGEQP